MDQLFEFLNKIPLWFVFLFLVFSYLVGLALSGLAFRHNSIFSHQSKEILKSDDDIITHNTKYRIAISKFSKYGEVPRIQGERYAVLVHITGHNAAAFFVFLILFMLSDCKNILNQENISIDILVFLIAVCLFLNHRRVRTSRTKFEQGIIEFVENELSCVSKKEKVKPIQPK